MPAWLRFFHFAARLTLECIGNSDALYHNIEHSMLVTLAGHDILMGRQMLRQTTAGDYANFILACLTHDIGYVRKFRWRYAISMSHRAGANG
jgi:hypothetical protein